MKFGSVGFARSVYYLIKVLLRGPMGLMQSGPMGHFGSRHVIEHGGARRLNPVWKTETAKKKKSKKK